MPWFAANQDAAHRSGRADAHRRVAALDLVGRRIVQIGTVTFAGVDHHHAGAPRRSQHVADRPDRGLEAAHVVAERGAEAAGLQEVALHVDDDEGGVLEFD